MNVQDIYGRFPLSHSTMDLARCPLALVNKLNKKPKDKRDADLARFGTEVHAIFEQLAKNPYVDDDILDKIISENVTADFEYIRRLAVKFLNTVDITGVLGTELKLAVDHNLNPVPFDDPNVLFRGIVDLLLDTGYIGEVTIVDHKTSFQSYDPNTPQLRKYAWLLWKNHPEFHHFNLAINFPRAGGLRTSDTQINLDDMPHIERALLAEADRIYNIEYPTQPNPGNHCIFCDWSSTCPASMFNEGEFDPVRLAQYVRVTEIKLAEAKKKLSQFTAMNGHVEIEGYEYGHFESTKYSVDINEVFDKLNDYPSLKEFIAVPGAKIKKLRKHPAEIEIIETPTTRFFGRKKKEE